MTSPGGVHASIALDVRGLERALRRAVTGEVRFDPAAKGMYASDASNYRQVPIGVVIPRTLDDVVATHRVCAEFEAPIVNRGRARLLFEMPIARSTSTCRPTRRSSYTTTTGPGSAGDRAMPTRSASSTRPPAWLAGCRNWPIWPPTCQ